MGNYFRIEETAAGKFDIFVLVGFINIDDRPNYDRILPDYTTFHSTHDTREEAEAVATKFVNENVPEAARGGGPFESVCGSQRAKKVKVIIAPDPYSVPNPRTARAPLDSRTASAPVDSRVNKPTNSRTPR